METIRIAVACFIGGALCCAVALIFAPIYWWFGLIAGMAGGYISYEFREVRKAIPIALRAARRESVYAWDGAIAKAKIWLSEPHYFFYPATLLALPAWGVVLVQSGGVEEVFYGKFTVFMSLFFVWFYVIFVMMSFGVIGILAMIGARISERCYWVPTMIASGGDQQKYFAELREKGYREVPLTYAGVLRWSAKGLGLTLKFFAWTLWKYLAIATWATICFFGRFAWHLFKLIRSKKRVLCAIDGTLGGAVSYLWFASSATTFPEQMVFIVFGGLIGAAFGVADWEIVSKRILHVSKSTSA